MTRAEEILRLVAEQDAERDPDLQLANTRGYSYASNSAADRGPRYMTGKKPSGVGSGTGESS